MIKDKIVKPERPGGFLDFLPSDYLAREKMIKTVEKVFRTFGFDPIETPRIEFLKTLAGETSDTGKNIFKIKSAHDNEPLAMPFDHTVPLARLLAANPYDSKTRKGIRLPWKRMVVGPVFRADTPQSGRYRQFYQFDADIAGTSSMLADAEIVAIIYQTLKELGVKRFKIRLNNRKILNGLAQLVNINDRPSATADDITKEMMRILDKIDKIGLEAVATELKACPQNAYDASPQLSDEDIAKIKAFLSLKGANKAKLEHCKSIFHGVKLAEEGIDELQQILEHTNCMGVPSAFIDIDFSIARGLDYYTGPVMEAVLTDAPEFGSIFGGGRYNNLVARFTGNELPATGASLGVDRLFAALNHLGLIDNAQLTVTDVMIMRIAQDHDADYILMASELRKIGVNTDISLLKDTTFKNQFNYAITRGVRFIVICGETEFEKMTVQVKNLETRKQEEMPRNKLTDYFTNRESLQ